MSKLLSKEALKIIKKMQQSEITESVIYEKIANFAKGEENKKTLLRLAKEEKNHYEIWKKYTNIEMKPQKFEHEEKMQMINVLNAEVIIAERKEYVNNAIKIYTKSVLDALSENDVSLIRFYKNEL